MKLVKIFTQNSQQEKTSYEFITSLQKVLNSSKSTANNIIETAQSAHKITKELDNALKTEQNFIAQAGNDGFAIKEASHDTNDGIIASKKHIEEVSKNLKNVEGIVHNFVEIESDMSEKLQELTQSAGEINNVLTVISDITDQTNLLALNATIEAAMAGEYDRSFTAITNEVKKLARRTQKYLSEIQDAVNIVVQSVNDASRNLNSDIMYKTSRISKISSNSSNNNIQKLDKLVNMVQKVDTLSNQSDSNSIHEIVQSTELLLKSSNKLNFELQVFKT